MGISINKSFLGFLYLYFLSIVEYLLSTVTLTVSFFAYVCTAPIIWLTKKSFFLWASKQELDNEKIFSKSDISVIITGCSGGIGEGIGVEVVKKVEFIDFFLEIFILT